jgi:transmembrane sensor
MEELVRKYLQDNLTSQELLELRKKVNCATDEQLSGLMLSDWKGEDIDESKADDVRIDEIRYSLEEQIGTRQNNYRLFKRTLQVAAAILLPVFIFSTLYLYRENTQQTSEEMVVSTAEGEHANITLPDGTKVNLNVESRLTYIPQTFNKKSRSITFDGEAYFSVSKNKDCPFVIHTQGFDVKVLGTKFNLLARAKEPIGELTLEDGSVSMTSVRTGQNVILYPNEKAIFDRATGGITVVSSASIEEATSWKRKELIFHNSTFSNVLQELEKVYHVKIAVQSSNYMPDLFTGTIPSSNLNEAIEIIEKSYHLQGQITGDKLILTPR